MQTMTANRSLVGVAPIAGLILSAVLTACSSAGHSTFTFFADPGQYQYHTCEQLAEERNRWMKSEQELKLLMDKAERSTGGAVVNLIAYKADHVAAVEELKVIEATAHAKNCYRAKTGAVAPPSDQVLLAFSSVTRPEPTEDTDQNLGQRDK